MQALKSFVREFDPILAQTVSARMEQAAIAGAGAGTEPYLAHAALLAKAGGKRIRPFMAWTMYQAGGGQDSAVLRLLSSIELFHLFALIHDDWMDQGELRHGIPTAHKAFTSTPFDLPPRVAASMAVLLGDQVLSWADRAWDDRPESVDALAFRRALEEYRTMTDEVVAGQMLDIRLTASKESDMATVSRKNELKTAGYTFVRPMKIGCLLSGDDRSIGFCETFGAAIGRAFQTRDDLLDVMADEATTAKTPFSDIAEGQHTVLTAHVQQHGSPDERQRLAAAMGSGRISAAHAADLRRLLTETGAIAAAEAGIAADTAAAQDALKSADLPEAQRSVLAELCAHLAHRPS